MSLNAWFIDVRKIREPKVLFRDYKELDGSVRKKVWKVGDGSIIIRFEKTPPPKKPTDVVCPHFLELKWANGCYFNCAWCYLQGTYRFHPEWKNGKPNIKDYNIIEEHVKALVINNGIHPELLNSGELSDSLLTEHTEKPFSRFILETLEKYDKKNMHKVLFVTKSDNVKNLVEEPKPKKAVVSFSLNAEKVAERWEKKAPGIKARINAAKRVYEAKYPVRIRIDPMVPVKNWEKHYANLVDEIFSNLIPERITLGSLRGLQSTINAAKDRSWVKYLSEKSNWGKKIPFNTRYEMYSTIINYLKKEYDYTNVALCKETVEIWNKLGMDYRRIRCNCII